MPTVRELGTVVAESDATLVRLSLVTPRVAHDAGVYGDRAITTHDVVAEGVQPQLRCPRPTGCVEVGKCAHRPIVILVLTPALERCTASQKELVARACRGYLTR